MQAVQWLLNQLAILGQLNLHQPVPSAGQPMRKIPPITNTLDSSGARMSMAPNLQLRTSEDQPPKIPSAEIQAIKQVSTELKSHMKQELINHSSEMLLKQYGMKPKQQSCMYRTPYPSG
jgi:hypothetical protein